ncbi:MAG TPA: ATP-binding protein, partial [bacterium]|nr:ATP-binding protein [bacterium]
NEATLEAVRHDMERATDFSVRVRWAAQRGAVVVRGAWTTVTRRARRIGRILSRASRRWYYRTEDAVLRLSVALGIRTHVHETILEFADLPSPEELEGRVQNLPPIYRRMFSPSPLKTRELMVGREKELLTMTEVVKRWREGRAASVAVVGPEGSGKTSLIQCFAEELDDDVPSSVHMLSARLREESDTVAAVSEWIGLSEPAADVDELVRVLKEGPRRILVVEGGHHLLLRVIGGRRAAETFLSLVLATRNHVLWVLTCRQYPWRRMDDLLRVSRCFTHLIDTPFHSAKELRQAITLRHRRTGLELRFSHEGLHDRKIRKLLLAHPPDAPPVQEALQDRFFQDLFSASGGNIDAALFYWLLSIRRDEDAAEVTVQPLRRPDVRFLDDFDRLHRFTLAEILNHGTLTPEEHGCIFRTDAARSRVVLEYLCQLHLIEAVTDATDAERRYKVNPAFWHVLSSSLESRSLLY